MTSTPPELRPARPAQDSAAKPTSPNAETKHEGRGAVVPTPAVERDLRRTGLHPDHWYPVLRSKKLRPGKPIGVSFAGDPIVVARTESGTVFALEDRCAHRQVPLSLGVVKGDYLQCGYHCWSYNHDGDCVGAPYVKDRTQLPDGVRSYPCREAHGLVWIYPGDRDRIDAATFPEIETAGDPSYKTRFLDRRIDCHYSFMHENLMDMNHQFLHRRFMGGIKTVFLDLREDERGVEVDYTFARVKGKQPIGERFIIGRGGTQAREVDLMTIRTEYPYQWLKFWTKNSDQPALDLWNCYIPVDAEQRVNHTFGLMNIRKPGIPGLIHVLWPFITWFTNNIFREDREIVELEQKAFDAQGADWNHEVFPVIRSLRGLLRRKGVDLTAQQD